MSLGERIKKVRKLLDLTQQKFASKIGLKQNSIALIESGKRNISEQAILSICREFDVNEEWLRDGTGTEIFKSTPNDLLDALSEKYNLSLFGRAVIEKMTKLDEKQWNAFQEFVTKIVADISEPQSNLECKTQGEVDDSVPLGEIDNVVLTKLVKLEYEYKKTRLENKELRKRIDAIEQEDALDSQEFKNTG